jgi:ABC-2 type transport system ATP-binding protein
MRRVDLEFDAPLDAAVLEAMPGVRDVSVDDHRATVSFDGKMAILLKAVTERYEVVDINTCEADLEEIFLAYYRYDQNDTATNRTEAPT